MSEERWVPPMRRRRRTKTEISQASGYQIGTPEMPVGVPLATRPGASTQAKCKTCGNQRK